MQNHILSENERLTIREYLATKKKLENFRNIKHRVFAYYDVLEKDYSLIVALKQSFKQDQAESDHTK